MTVLLSPSWRADVGLHLRQGTIDLDPSSTLSNLVLVLRHKKSFWIIAVLTIFSTEKKIILPYAEAEKVFFTKLLQEYQTGYVSRKGYSPGSSENIQQSRTSFDSIDPTVATDDGHSF